MPISDPDALSCVWAQRGRVERMALSSILRLARYLDTGTVWKCFKRWTVCGIRICCAAFALDTRITHGLPISLALIAFRTSVYQISTSLVRRWPCGTLSIQARALPIHRDQLLAFRNSNSLRYPTKCVNTLS